MANIQLMLRIQKKTPPATESAKNASSFGFTLIEVISVLTLLTIVAVVVISRLNGSSITVYADADRLVSDLRYAQTLAMTNAFKGNGTVTVEINSNGWKFPSGSDWRFADGETERTLQWADSIPNHPQTVSFFYPYGKADASHNIEIQNGKTLTISVEEETGYVEIQ